MTEYTITPERQPGWSLTAEDFAERLKVRWPEARIGINDLPKSPMGLHALIPQEPPMRELGLALNRRGNMVLLDPAEPETATEFILWFVHQLPDYETPVYVFTEQMDRSPALRPELTAEDLRAFFDNPRGSA